MKIKHEFVTREIAGDTLLVPTGKTALDLNGMLTLNEVGAFIWQKLPQAENEEEIVEAVLAEFDADRDTVQADIREFVLKLRELDIL